MYDYRCSYAGEGPSGVWIMLEFRYNWYRRRRAIHQGLFLVDVGVLFVHVLNNSNSHQEQPDKLASELRIDLDTSATNDAAAASRTCHAHNISTRHHCSRKIRIRVY